MQRPVLAAAARRVISLTLMVATCSVALPALADNRVERDALALRKKAIEEDNLNVDYAGAVRKLQTAVAQCGTTRCDTLIQASLLRDLGAMQILSGNVDEGRASFQKAQALAASIDLDPAYKNPTLDGIWADVKKGGAAGKGDGGGPGGASGAPPSGDFNHAPAPEAQVQTPLAVYAEYTGSERIGRVVAKYKANGTAEWKSIDLKKVGEGYGVLLPCRDILEGSVQYYIVGFNAQNDPVATAGSRSQPFTVAVNAQASGPVAALPGQDPPTKCGSGSSPSTAAIECPPDFPGCDSSKAGAEGKSGGDDCASDKECASGSCPSGKCTSAKEDGGACTGNEDCPSGKCEDSKCSGSSSEGARSFKRLWVGVSVQADLYAMPSATTACTLSNPGQPVNSVGYFCVDNANHAFPPATGTLAEASAANNSILPGGDRVGGGLTLGNIRVLATVDYALSANLLLGARVGYVLATNPATTGTGLAFQPLHGEARLTYLFGVDALANTVAPLVFAALGVGEFDGAVSLQVNLANRPALPVNAWVTAGPVFGAAGAGARWKVSERVALTVAAKLEAAFGGTAGTLFGIAPEAGVGYGF